MCPGRVSNHQNPTPSLKPAFDVLDADQDGRISSDDLRTFYHSFTNSSITDESMIGSMISAADLDKNGFVEYEEFQRVVRGGGNRGGSGFGFAYEEVVEEMLKVMDGDGDGKVGFEDLKMWLGEMGMKVSEEEIKAMVRLGGGEGGGVSVDGLRRILGFDV